MNSKVTVCKLRIDRPYHSAWNESKLNVHLALPLLPSPEMAILVLWKRFIRWRSRSRNCGKHLSIFALGCHSRYLIPLRVPTPQGGKLTWLICCLGTHHKDIPAHEVMRRYYCQMQNALSKVRITNRQKPWRNQHRHQWPSDLNADAIAEDVHLRCGW